MRRVQPVPPPHVLNTQNLKVSFPALQEVTPLVWHRPARKLGPPEVRVALVIRKRVHEPFQVRASKPVP